MCPASRAGSREPTREVWLQSLHRWGPCLKRKFMKQLCPQHCASPLLWAGHTGPHVFQEARPRASPAGSASRPHRCRREALGPPAPSPWGSV